ncbi:MAG: methyl-accepting chemotaxis protein [Gallionella sp.]|nr:methyl-accepting chemotaxis protein [Gallionella sp.]
MAFNIKLPNFKAAKNSGTGGADMELPLIGHLSFAMKLRILGGGAVLSLLVAVVAAGLDQRTTSHGTHYLDLSGDLVMLTQRIAKDAVSAMQGNQTAIDGLPKGRVEAEKILEALDKGDALAPPSSGDARTALNTLLPAAQTALQYIKDIEDARAGLQTVVRAVEAVEEVGPPIREAIGRMTASGVNNESATKFALLIERIGKDANAMLGGAVTDEMVGALGRDTEEAEALLASFDKTNPDVAQVVDLFEGYRNSVYAVISQAQSLFGAKRGLANYFESVSVTHKGPFITNTVALRDAYDAALRGRFTLYLMVAGATLMLFFAGLLSRLYLVEARHHAAVAEATNKQNQRAILRLMNELSDLAEGDLTVRATVTEDITGAIADSVNYTAEELRKLVSRITEASTQMGLATRDSEGMAQRLMASTQSQVNEIKGAEESVQLIARSIAEVDSAAVKAAEVGRHTLEVTHQGALAVRNTIAGMDGIREHIQETSKRIKRLGESSQEIGEIVDLISDITEQTNVLALNAAIQAATAGEAGRGFSVVAEEVQRLAERSADATKQIGALVKTIQSDTQDAVAAMEKSTLGVVEGAKLSEVAGQSLKEIEQVSNELAMLLDSISVSTQVQTEMAVEVSGVMHDIIDISEQTTEGSRLTFDFAAKLSSLASGLKGSVAGFKL